MSSTTHIDTTSQTAAPVPEKRITDGYSITCFFVVTWVIICGLLAVRYFCAPSYDRRIQDQIETVASTGRPSEYDADVYVCYEFPYFEKETGQECIVPVGMRLAKKSDAVADSFSWERVKAYVAFANRRGGQLYSFQGYFQAVILAGLMLTCFGFCLYRIHPSFFLAKNRVIFCLVLVLVHFSLMVDGQRQLVLHGYNSAVHLLALLPMFMIPALATYLLGMRASVCMSLLLTTLTPLIQCGGIQFVLFEYSLLCSVSAIAMYRRAVCRYDLVKCGLGQWGITLLLCLFFTWRLDMTWAWTELGNFVSTIVHSPFWGKWTWGDLAASMADVSMNFWCQLLFLSLVNAVMTMFVMQVFPAIFERFFDVVAPSTLYQLSLRNHVLLKEMKEKANGTYKHCFNVSDMAEAAAKAIGANSLLAMVCGAFHDIGKLDDPYCFAENTNDEHPSPHNDLAPEESARRIIAHVISGGEKAKQYHLPHPVRTAICSHHGNDLVMFFYRKAVNEAEAKGQPMPKDEAFRYKAPMPHHREAVIVEIADICEAASRAEIAKLEHIDHEHVKPLVDKWVMAKMQNRQFACAEMTLAEFTKICDVMVDEIIKLYPQRPKYSISESPEGEPVTGIFISPAPTTNEKYAPKAPVSEEAQVVSSQTKHTSSAAETQPVIPILQPLPVAQNEQTDNTEDVAEKPDELPEESEAKAEDNTTEHGESSNEEQQVTV